MRFADIPGNDDVKRALRGMADSGRVAHAMLFYENEGCGGLPMALAYFQYLNCQDRRDGDSCGECPSCRKISRLIHPDLHFVFPVNSGSKVSASDKPVSESYLTYWRELVLANPYFLESELYAALGIEGKSGNIAVAEAKSILDKLTLSPVEGGNRAIVIWLPEKMNAEAANRLLKVVEEPPENTLFLLITHSPEKVLQTIFSRCQSFRISPLSKDQVAATLHSAFSVSEEQARSLASVSGGSIGTALEMLGERAEYSEYMEMFKDLIQSSLSRNLLGALEAGERISALSSREKQRAFCIFAEDCIRKIYMIRCGMDAIAYASAEDRLFFADVASMVRDSFCSKVSGYFDSAAGLIDRNVNAKIVFCDLVDRIYISV